MGFTAKFVAVCASCLAVTFPVAAATVCVLVVESGLPAEAERVEASSAWEAGLMDAFFDAGHIVTNGPLFREEKLDGKVGPTLPDRNFGLLAAKDGGADYLSIVVLDYGNVIQSPDGMKRPSPSGVAYRILDLGTGTVIAEGLDEVRPKTVATVDEAREAGKVARIMMTRLKER